MPTFAQLAQEMDVIKSKIIQQDNLVKVHSDKAVEAHVSRKSQERQLEAKQKELLEAIQGIGDFIFGLTKLPDTVTAAPSKPGQPKKGPVAVDTSMPASVTPTPGQPVKAPDPVVAGDLGVPGGSLGLPGEDTMTTNPAKPTPVPQPVEQPLEEQPTDVVESSPTPELPNMEPAGSDTIPPADTKTEVVDFEPTPPVTDGPPTETGKVEGDDLTDNQEVPTISGSVEVNEPVPQKDPNEKVLTSEVPQLEETTEEEPLSKDPLDGTPPQL